MNAAPTLNGYRLGHYPDDFDMALRFWPDVCFLLAAGALIGLAVAWLWALTGGRR